MFYCNPCAEARSWPTDTLMRSRGRCELCGTGAICNDVPSGLLPLPPGVEPLPEPDRSRDRYFLTENGGSEREVDLPTYLNAERRAGFHNHYGPDRPATGGFSHLGQGLHLRGRIEYASEST